MIQFLEPWYEFLPGQAQKFLSELRAELSSGHPLYGWELEPLGHSGAADDALFRAQDGQVVQVHVTLSGRPELAPLPRHRVYQDLAAWVQEVMMPTHEEYCG